MVMRPVPSDHWNRARPSADSAAQTDVPNTALAASAVSIPSAMPMCPSSGIGKSRTTASFTLPSIFLPAGALALPSSSRKRPALQQLDPLWDELFPFEQARIVALLVERVDIGTGGLNVRLRMDGLGGLAREMLAGGIGEAA